MRQALRRKSSENKKSPTEKSTCSWTLVTDSEFLIGWARQFLKYCMPAERPEQSATQGFVFAQRLTRSTRCRTCTEIDKINKAPYMYWDWQDQQCAVLALRLTRSTRRRTCTEIDKINKSLYMHWDWQGQQSQKPGVGLSHMYALRHGLSRSAT